MRVYKDVSVFRCNGIILRLVRWTRSSDGRVFYRIKYGRVFKLPVVFSDYQTANAHYCGEILKVLESNEERRQS